MEIAEAHKLQLGITVASPVRGATHRYVGLEGTGAMFGKLQASAPGAQSSSPWASSHESLSRCPSQAFLLTFQLLR